MKIAVFGAGAIGGFMGAKLALAGQDVSLIARGPHLAAMRERGLELRSEGKTQIVRPRTTDDPREIGPLLPGVEDEIEDFYDGIQPYTFDDFHGDLMRVTSGQTDPVLSRILVQNSKDTVFWMNRVGNIRMEPATSLTGVRKGNKIIWARGLVVRAAHEGVGLSRSWFATAERLGIEIRYGTAATELLTAALADRLRAVDAYVAPVQVSPEQGVRPGNLREWIRCNGPTVAFPGQR